MVSKDKEKPVGFILGFFQEPSSKVETDPLGDSCLTWLLPLLLLGNRVRKPLGK